MIIFSRAVRGFAVFTLLLAILAIGLSLDLAQGRAAGPAGLGWVGNMVPTGGSSNTIVTGGSFDVYVQVWKSGVTDSAGQGANISCSLHWGQVANFGGGWSNISDTAMSYHGDIGNNDEYKATISPGQGLYEFTAWCSDDGGTTKTWQQDGNGKLTVNAASGEISDARAIWLDQQTIAWNGAAGSSYKLLFDPDGGLDTAVAGGTACPASPIAPCFLDLTASGTVSGYPKNPNATGLTRLLLPGGVLSPTVKALLTGQVAVAAYDGGGDVLDASAAQIQSVLDDLYVDNGTADEAILGVRYSGGVPSVSLWAPTAQSVSLLRFADADTPLSTTHAMALDPASGVWSLSGDASWDRQFYLFDVQVYAPVSDTVLHNIVSDPYAISLSADSSDPADPRSQFVNLDDADLKPAGWDSLSKPTLANPEDIVIYEMHVRDFSINDSTVITAHRGTYKAFTYDGAGPHANETLSDGMAHLLALQEAGLTHVHLLPVFDIASVPEDNVARTVSPAPIGFGRDSDQPQAVISATRHTDGFNWGYDPFHYGAPEGSYSTDPDGVLRILEFREMVSSLNQNGLRVVMDVVYNHTAASGQEDKSLLDKVVPGYYHRYDSSGTMYNSSCCSDTATEYAMMEKLMIDTLERWAIDYKVDGFRFDLMNLHTRQNMLDVQAALAAIDPDIYLYGEGWDFGSAAAKGLTACPNCYAKQNNMTGAGIGLFNDKIRDAAHGGYSTDSTQIRKQGFSNGLSYDWNGYFYANRNQSDLHAVQDVLRSGLRASGVDWNGQGSPFTDDPQESVPYISKHDNETLFDQNVFKLPVAVSMAERVRAQNLGLSLIGLSQGVPFFHMGSDILRSKSLDRNSYDSGDWFNRVDWSYGDGSYSNNFGVGLPPAWDNQDRWTIMQPLLADTALDPAAADAQFSAGHLRELLRIRKSSPLFRLTTEADVNQRVSFYNGDNSVDGLLVMALSDTPEPDLDANYETILVFFNAHKIQQTFTISGAAGFSLHPVQADSTDADPLVQTASFDQGTERFTIPARTTAVFVSAQAITPPAAPSSIDWVGDMYPAGGSSTERPAGDASGLTVYVQVYEAGVTGSNNGSTGDSIDCYLHWGRYGESWSDLAMAFNAGFTGNANNDEYYATIPSSNLAVGTYGFTAYCTDDGGASKKWRAGSDGVLSVTPSPDPDPQAPPTPGAVFVHLFEWKWSDIAKECAYLAEQGYAAVQVSPPMEHIDNPAWWARYQPVSYTLSSRSGTPAEFQAMVTACNGAGVDVYVDAVVNHMAGPPADDVTYTGWNGTLYRSYSYPYPAETLYGPADFKAASGLCGSASGEIEDYGDRSQVQNCELLGLSDLHTGNPATLAKIQAYLNGLIGMGVKGFRIDAAKHIFAWDVEQLLAGLDDTFALLSTSLSAGGRPFIFQEVIEAPGEPVQGFEYFYNGDVTEFDFSNQLGVAFSGNPACTGTLAGLETFGSGAAFMPSQFAVVFSDNHDNQRGHGTANPCIVTHQDGPVYDLANIFMLAWPYGYPKVMSSYYFSDDDQGPPASPVYDGDSPAGCNESDWVCEHRRPAISNMVAFRQVTAGEPVSDWETISADHIAFGRGDRGFVAINREAVSATHTYQTGLAEGVYCDVTQGELAPDGASCSGRSITVNASGQIVDQELAALDAFAIHAEAKITPQVCPDPDVDGNGSLDILDLIAVAEAWNAGDVEKDVNCDGLLDIRDVLIVAAAIVAAA